MRNEELDVRLIQKIETNGGRQLDISWNESQVEIIRSIKQSPNLRRFLNELQSNLDYRKLFWNHKYHFTPFKGIDLQILYCESSPNIPIEPLEFESSKALGELEVDIGDAIDRFLPSLKDFLRNLKANATDILSDGQEETEEEAQQTALANFVADVLIDFNEESSFPELVNFVISNASDIILPIAANMVSATKHDFAIKGRKYASDILTSSQLTSDEMRNVSRYLTHNFELMRPLISLVWCPKCLRDAQSYYAIGARDPPESICPVCNSKMGVGTAYYFDASLASLFRSRDGIPSLSVMWALSQNNIEWIPGAYIKTVDNDCEKDIIFKQKGADGYGIIEVKAHMRDSPERTIEDRLRADVKQLLKNYSIMQKADVKINNLILVTNSPRFETKNAASKLFSNNEYREIKDKTTIICPENFDELIDKIKGDS